MTWTSSSASAHSTAARISPGIRMSIALRRSGRFRRRRAIRRSSASWAMPRLLKTGMLASVGSEAVDARVAAGGLQCVVAAAARLVRRVPRLRRHALVEAGAIAVADHRRTLAALGPVAAGRVDAAGDRRAVGLRAGQDVVHVRRVATAVDDIALLGERGLLGEVVRAMQLGHAVGDDDALGVAPRAGADAVARVDGGLAAGCRLRAEVGAPGLVARAGRGRERAAQAVGTGEPAEVGAATRARARDEEAQAGGRAGSHHRAGAGGKEE